MAKIIKNPLKCHLFICTNQREDEESCGNKGSLELQQNVKAQLKAKGVHGIRINKSGCLGLCSEGIVAALYPKNVFITELTSNDEKVLVKMVEDLNKVN